MAQPMMQQPRQVAWLPYAGFIVAVAGMVYQSGQLSNQIKSNTDRITVLEISDRAKDAKLSDINVRGAENATKLDFLVQQARDVEQRRRSR
jgi:hypothetical protein